MIGRTSAAQFKGKPADLREVGRKLDARYIVEGTVRQQDGRVSIFVSLVPTPKSDFQRVRPL